MVKRERDVKPRYWARAGAGLLSAVLALALVVLGMSLLSAPSELVSSVTRTGELHFAAGTTAAYRWSMKTSAFPRDASAPLESRLEGELGLRVLAAHPTKLALQLSPLVAHLVGQRSPTLERALSKPFTVDVDEVGEFAALGSTGHLAEGERQTLDGAVRALQFVVMGGKQSWATRERDQNGEFEAEYRRADDGTVVKTKTRYLESQHAGAVAIRVVKSSLQATLDHEGSWLATLRGVERVKLEAPKGQPIAEVETTFELVRLGSAIGTELANWIDDGGAAHQGAVATPNGAWAAASMLRERQRLSGTNLRTLLDGLSTHEPGDAAFAREFALFLQVFQEESRRLPALLSTLNEAEAASLLSILGAAGTAQAQDALIEIAASAEQTADNRFRALVAMTSLDEPNTKVVDYLMQASSTMQGKAGSVELASTALLTLGSVGSHASDAARQRIQEWLQREVDATSDSTRQRALLLGLQNGRMGVDPSKLRSYCSSTSAEVREAAVGLFAFVSADEQPNAELLALFEREPIASVRRAAVNALLQLPANEAANRVLAQALDKTHSSDTALRGLLVAYLAKSSTAFPGNRALLRAELKRETDRSTIISILNSP